MNLEFHNFDFHASINFPRLDLICLTILIVEINSLAFMNYSLIWFFGKFIFIGIEIFIKKQIIKKINNDWFFCFKNEAVFSRLDNVIHPRKNKNGPFFKCSGNYST